MYTGFKLDLSGNSFEKFLDEGHDIYEKQRKQTMISLNDFILKGNTLDGSAIQNFWFPEIEADIFLSHSYNDLDQAKALVGWIKSTFNLNVFIDSSVWLHGKDLKRDLANKYCPIEGTNLYDYDAFSHASTHVDIMLSTALSRMIDKCECLFFLNTPNSIQPYAIVPRTESAWIYHELEVSKIIHKRKPNRPSWANESKDILNKALGALTISYEVDTVHLHELRPEKMASWHESSRYTKEHALDVLYQLFNNTADRNFLKYPFVT